MNTLTTYAKTNQNNFIKYWLCSFSILFIIIGLCLEPLPTILNGFSRLFNHSDRLITDYVVVAGFGTTFVNAGLLMLASVFLLHISKAKMSGISIAGVFLMGGFGMFGKSIFNVWGIFVGVFLYAKIQHQPFSQHIYVAFFGTALAPVATELALWLIDVPGIWFYAFVAEMVVGFLLPVVSAHGLSAHQGYNLYNVGFGAGLIGTLCASIMSNFGYQFSSNKLWYDKHEVSIIIIMYVIFCGFIILSYLIDHTCFQKYRRMLRKSGRLVSDFLLTEGVSAVLLNMGLLGIVYTSYILAIGSHLNGPTIGGILTIVGFGGFGKHLKNTIPISLGVILGVIVGIWDITSSSVVLGTLFATGLAPIAGQFGPFYGILAGFLHLSIVLHIGSFHGAMNLYNNGFSAGLIAMILLPIIEAFHTTKLKRKKT